MVQHGHANLQTVSGKNSTHDSTRIKNSTQSSPRKQSPMADGRREKAIILPESEV